MNLRQAISLYAADNREPEQADNSSLSGKRFRVVDQGYGHVVSEHDTYDDAFRAMMAKPYTKILTGPFPDQRKRDAAFRKSQESNPDLEAYGTSEGAQKAWDTRGRKGFEKVFKDNQLKGKLRKDAYDNHGGSLKDGTLVHVYGHDNSWRHIQPRTLVGTRGRLKGLRFPSEYTIREGVGHAALHKHLKEYAKESNQALDAQTAAPVSPKSSLFPRDDETESQQLRDTVRRRMVRTNPDVD